MKKYRVKIDMPNFEKGEILEYENGVYKNKYSWVERPIDYPDCFEEIKEPLFVTEDGVELFEDSIVWGVFKINPQRIFKNYISHGLSKEYCYWFSTKQAAEKWIDENKPMFSKKQILDILGRNFIGNISVQYLKKN